MLVYGARFNDPAVGRFTTVDPLAEKFSFQTGYAYAANNPILFVDFNGDSIKINKIYETTTTTAKNGGVPTDIHDLGKTYISNASATGNKDGTLNLNITITIAVHPDVDNSPMANQNPGLGEEVRDHEDGHGDQFEENFNKEHTIDGITGNLDEIMVKMIENGVNPQKAFNKVFAAGSDLDKVYGNRENVEIDANKRAVKKTSQRNPEQKTFYKNGTKQLNTWPLDYMNQQNSCVMPIDNF